MKYSVDVKRFIGDLPRHKSGPNAGRVDRSAVAALYGMTVSNLIKAYVNWQDIFRIVGSTLTYRQYLDKMNDVGISPDQVGNGRDQFNLSRYGDQGVYSSENCRFISRRENEMEQCHPPATMISFSCGYCGSSGIYAVAGDREKKFCSRRCGIMFNQPWLRRTA